MSIRRDVFFFFFIGEGGSEGLWEKGSMAEIGLIGVVFDVDGELIVLFHRFVI